MPPLPKLPPPKPRRRPLTRLSPKLHVPMTASEQLQWENKRRKRASVDPPSSGMMERFTAWLEQQRKPRS